MTNTLWKRQTSWYVLALVAVACSGCQSMKGTTDKWSTAWKEKSKPKPAAPKPEETVTYWGQKKKQPKQVEMPAELKEKLAQRSEATDRSRSFADSFKEGNQHLEKNRLKEARLAYEQALAAKPNDPYVHHRLAVVADKENLFGVADDHYEAALRQRPRDPDLLSDLGYSHFLRGNDPQAEQILQKALAVDPSHTGAMANLGAIYSKQGRYDEAFAMFRHGATEAEAQQYIAQLFPKGRPMGASPAGTALAQNPAATGQRAAPPMPGDNRPDLGAMSLEQVKSEMERKRQESIQKRQQQQLAEISPPRDWSNDHGTPTHPQSPATGTQPWIVGPPTGSGIAQAQTQNPVQVTPYPSNPGQGGFTGGQPGSPAAPAGTNPQENMEFWKGAPVQQYQTQTNVAPSQTHAPPNTNPWGTPPSAIATPTPGVDLSRLGDSLQQSGDVALAGYQPEPSANGGGSSASQAAAQLGMSAGPGSLFPVMAGDSAAPNPATPSQAPAFVPRFGAEFSPTPQYQNPANSPAPAFVPRFGSEFTPPPQYQNPSNQFAPHGVNRPAESRFSASSGGAWSNSPMPAQSTAPQNPLGNETSMSPSIAPASPASNWTRPMDAPLNWQQPNSGSPVVHAGGTPAPWGQPAIRSSDALETFQSEMNAGANARAASSAWGNSSGQSSGSRPYSGNWPNNSSASGAAPASGTSSSNAIPAWNGGSAANGAGQNSFGSSASGAANDSLPQWPHAPQR